MTAILCLLGIAGMQAQTKPVYLDNRKTIEQRVEDALSRMTIEEKVAMCHAQSKFSSHGVPRLGIPEIWMSDGPHGVREEIEWDAWGAAKWTNDSCTAFPALTCLAATFNPSLSHEYGVAIGEEARYRRKDILLGPGVNIYRTPLNGRNFEYMGEDPYLAGRMAIPYIKGVQENGVAACVKHYALNNQEVWRGHINVNLSDRALHEIYLPAFKAAVEEGGAWSIMGSYNQFRGEHCCHNDLLLNKILKGDWKFDGVVVTDWGGAHDTKQSVFNGLDIEMGSYTNGLSSRAMFGYEDFYLAKPFLTMLKKGEVPVSVLDDKVRRILRLTFRTNMMPDRPYGRFVCNDHSTAARRVAEEGIVLLKNEKQFLPISTNQYKKIAVIGENASRSLTEGGGSSTLKVKYEVSPLDGFKQTFGADKVVYCKGYSSGPSMYGRVIAPKENQQQLFDAAVKAAKDADIVFFVGGLNKNHQQDCEAGDRITYNLPFNQDKLIEEILKVNKNVVVLLASGNAVAMPWLKDVPAVLQAWYLGSESGNAIANVITGKVNPSGKLPFSFPVKLEDNAAHSFGKLSYPGDSTNVFYKEDILVGYRWFDTKKIKPLFPFGYGLSYSTFEYGKIATDKKTYGQDETIKVSFTLKNTGKVDGAEAVQVYASQPKASVMRPAKELKAFAKVFLKAGETQTVALEVKVKDLAFYNEKTNNWTVESGEFVLRNAASAADVKSSVSIQIK
ncbi:glycoside hydrolase family 3 domain protein [Paludibacter propionicigenes WB4]|uniref:Glycoside hydrolase family 3 domain protein n=2 Tax=Paludibacter TaxID=346096 RepID=E4T6A9_PALPW|nr:glycoside hydrolase family 3 domain protein [Paludibacter propionicigenes WB4]